MSDTHNASPGPSAKAQNGLVSLVSPGDPVNWETLPEYLTTNEVAQVISKDAPNVRARASKGEFGNVEKDDKGRSLYSRQSVRDVHERLAKNRNATAMHGVSAQPSGRSNALMPPALVSLLSEMREASGREIALWQARHEDKEREVEILRRDSETLRALLSQREETTRETLSEIAGQYDARVGEIEQHRAETIAAKDIEIERLKRELEIAKHEKAKRRNFFGWGA